jgi:hypothetical protein
MIAGSVALYQSHAAARAGSRPRLLAANSGASTVRNKIPCVGFAKSRRTRESDPMTIPGAA